MRRRRCAIDDHGHRLRSIGRRPDAPTDARRLVRVVWLGLIGSGIAYLLFFRLSTRGAPPGLAGHLRHAHRRHPARRRSSSARRLDAVEPSSGPCSSSVGSCSPTARSASGGCSAEPRPEARQRTRPQLRLSASPGARQSTIERHALRRSPASLRLSIICPRWKRPRSSTRSIALVTGDRRTACRGDARRGASGHFTAADLVGGRRSARHPASVGQRSSGLWISSNISTFWNGSTCRRASTPTSPVEPSPSPPRRLLALRTVDRRDADDHGASGSRRPNRPSDRLRHRRPPSGALRALPRVPEDDQRDRARRRLRAVAVHRHVARRDRGASACDTASTPSMAARPASWWPPPSSTCCPKPSSSSTTSAPLWSPGRRPSWASSSTRPSRPSSTSRATSTSHPPTADPDAPHEPRQPAVETGVNPVVGSARPGRSHRAQRARRRWPSGSGSRPAPEVGIVVAPGGHGPRLRRRPQHRDAGAGGRGSRERPSPSWPSTPWRSIVRHHRASGRVRCSPSMLGILLAGFSGVVRRHRRRPPAARGPTPAAAAGATPLVGCIAAARGRPRRRHPAVAAS